VEGLGVSQRSFWKGRRVFLTGHTGFKGSWLSMWLSRWGAEVTGYALAPPTEPSLFVQAGVQHHVKSITADVRDAASVATAMREAAPELVLHLAAQALVRESYDDPVGTYATNVMGTVHVLEAMRTVPSVRAAVIVTSDKCYENREWVWPYRETDPMGGHDPYSNSKGCAELVTAAYTRSFLEKQGLGIASVRAGNVIGGGDWAKDRLVPDAARSFVAGKKVRLRNPLATRPWQHVLEPLGAYLAVGQALLEGNRSATGAWNIGPDSNDTRTVQQVVEAFAPHFGPHAGWEKDGDEHPHEARSLALDTTRIRATLGWRPRLGLDEGLAWTARWYRDVAAGRSARDATLEDLERYEARP
jgi:CDP-glucose 4,6-dehydratase